MKIASVLTTGDITPLDGGFEIDTATHILNSTGYQRVYKVDIGSGIGRVFSFYVDAPNSQDAVDRVVDFCEDNEFDGLYYTYDEVEEMAEEDGVSASEYIVRNDLVTAGNHCHYVMLERIFANPHVEK